MSVRFCPVCGTARQPGDAFCRNCGRSLAEDDAREAQARADVRTAAVVSTPAPPAPQAAPASTPPPAAPPPGPPPAPPGYVVVPSTQSTIGPSAPPPAPPPVPAAGASTTAVIPPTAPPPAGSPGRGVAGLKGPVRPLALIGAAAVAIGVFLPWLSDAAGSGNGFDVPLAFLWSLEASEGLKLGVVMLLVAGAAIGLSFVPGMGPIRRILGAGASVAALAFVGQVYRAVDRFGGGPGDVFDTLGVAVYVTFVGGMLLSTSK